MRLLCGMAFAAMFEAVGIGFRRGRQKLSVDELQNLWCVLTGQMRLVGPRLEAPEFYSITPDEMYKFARKPDITGLAQVKGHGLLNWGETLASDLQYVRTRSED